MAQSEDNGRNFADWSSDLVLRVVIRIMLFLPYSKRVPAMGWFMRKILAPVAGYNARSLENLHYIYPDMDDAERRRIVLGVADNVGRTFIENYSTKEFLKRNSNTKLNGPGFPALEQAQKDGTPVVLVSGHFGNYEAPRAALVARGFNVGGLYRPAANKYFNSHYEKTMLAYGGPVFAQGHKGTSGFVRHLKSGGVLVLLFDQHVVQGTPLPFLGKPAKSALSASELALRYGALLIPFFGIRKENGVDFDIQFDAPIEHSDPKTMTLEMNKCLEKRIEANPEQWFWVHRRWKVGRKQKKA